MHSCQAMNSSEESLRRKGSRPSTRNQPYSDVGIKSRVNFSSDRNSRGFEAGDLGFEPRLKESESFVLPLHQSPKLSCERSPAAGAGGWVSNAILLRSAAANAMRYGTPRLTKGQYRRRPMQGQSRDIQWKALGGRPSSAWACEGAEKHGHVGVPPRPWHPSLDITRDSNVVFVV